MWRNLALIIKHDAGRLLREWTFWLFSFLMPGLLLAYLTYNAAQDARPAATPEPAAPAQPGLNLPPIGLVDEAGLIQRLPPGLPADWLIRYPDLAAAQAALAAGAVEQVIHLPADYLAAGHLTIFDRDFQLLSSGEGMGLAYGSADAWVLAAVINYNLTGDAGLAALLRDPTPAGLAARHPLAPPAAEGAAASPLADWVASVVPFIFYFLLVLSGSYLMRSVVAEKENRTAEVLLLSVPPHQLMAGKILAMSVVLTVQLLIWAGGAALMVRGWMAGLPFQAGLFPPGFWLWAAVFLVLGYLLFAAVMAAAGALAPNAREGGQMIWVLILPLMPTLMFSSEMIAQPQSPLTLFL
ncbi:MAG: ABC transporter permease, partial [Anaerolineales bacterium]|nr:ABC transporter permease [Anaerolineales bacterium]